MDADPMRTEHYRILLLAGMLAATASAGLATGCAGQAGMTEPAVSEVSGTVTYRQRMALPPDAVIRVRLADVSRQDAPADVVAEIDVPAAGRQVPVPFRLTFPASRIDPAHTYSVSARILIEGRLSMISTTFNPVLTRGAPDRVEIVVSPVNAPPDGGQATDPPQ
jgi:putative lipoprotein